MGQHAAPSAARGRRRSSPTCARDDARGRLRYASEAAALDLVQGTVLAGMRTVLEGRAGSGHASVIAALVLRGLGVAPADADVIARRPLPPLADAAATPPPPSPRQRLARGHRPAR